MKFILLALTLSMFSTLGMACSEDGSSGFVEKNDLFIPEDSLRVAGLTEAQFNAAIDRVEVIYLPLAANLGGKLAIARKWSDGTVNANASRSGSKWKVNMYGGLARHESITEDGFSLVVCHEIGHLMGGAPAAGMLFSKPMSNEGQSDYWAALKCLRKTFLNDDNAAINSRVTIPATLAESCAKAHPTDSEKQICIRTGMAGVSVAAFFAKMRNLPEATFDTPDRSVVSSTNSSHPAHQCRLDTYFQGSLCEVSFNEDVSMKDEVQGTCHSKVGHTSGLRPTCWFKPKVQ